MSLNGKTALITGASRGIGAATAAAFAAAGARVVGTATGDAGIAAIRESGHAALLYDAADREQSAALAKAVEGEYGGADIVVINAAVNADGLLLRMKEEAWQKVLDVNLGAPFRLTQALARGLMKREEGRVIFISSVVAAVGNAGQTNYCAAKAGLEGYCRAMAKEMAPRGVTVNAVAPGFIDSDMTRRLPPSLTEQFLRVIPMGRAGAAEEVAAAAAFLASPAASYITGQVLHVNGGMYMG